MVPSGSHMFLPTICWKFLHPRLQHHVSGFLHVSVILGNSKQLWGVRDHLIDLIRHLPCLARAAAHGEAVAQLWIWWWRKLTEDKLMKLEDVRSLRWLNFLRTDWGAERFMAGWMFGCIEMFGCLDVWMFGSKSSGCSLEKPSVLFVLHMLRIFKIFKQS